MAALAVDELKSSEALRRRYKLPFPLLCDTQHKVVRAWGLYNSKEKGGIARPAMFLLDSNRRVHCASLDEEVRRVHAREMLAYLRATSGAKQPGMRVVIPTLGDWLHTVWPAVRLMLFPSKK